MLLSSILIILEHLYSQHIVIHKSPLYFNSHSGSATQVSEHTIFTIAYTGLEKNITIKKPLDECIIGEMKSSLDR